ncbi:hypothetical protein FRX31_023637 [Thalictrum thalictroides]|uniref:Uncharacterized protein n=1 Tax=Thalictrum thalictroides TaxID=46969 RepID=A0A7J6VNU5_THATH|nr:hypothetical protein FRX31_023637 [Thalictrum thalictroides]
MSKRAATWHRKFIYALRCENWKQVQPKSEDTQMVALTIKNKEKEDTSYEWFQHFKAVQRSNVVEKGNETILSPETNMPMTFLSNKFGPAKDIEYNDEAMLMSTVVIVTMLMLIHW